MKKLVKCAALLFALFLLLGCDETVEDYYRIEGGEVHAPELFEVMGMDAPMCDPTDENCICMVCTGGESDSLNPYHWFYDLPLTGGECTFRRNCTREFFTEGFEEEEESFIPFMFGMGSNFAEFAYANVYCNNSARLAVRWLQAREGFDYPLPAHERAECFLDKDVFPMYLLYSNGSEMSVQRAGRIASEFNGAGPVILSSEFDFNPNDAAAIGLAVEQAFAMKDACPNCLVAVSPRYEYNRSLDADGNVTGYSATYEAIDYIFSTYPDAYTKIDLVGVGLNSHHAPNCEAASLIYDGIDYSNYVLETYGKPSIWAYVLLDEGGYNAGGQAEGTCAWNSSEVIKAYGDLYKYSPALVHSGVIGAAPYSLYGMQGGPLECGNCGLMSMEKELYPQHSAWFSLCQNYYTNRGYLFLVFSQSPCADCSFANNFNLFQLDSFRSGSAPAPGEQPAVSPFSTFYRCNGQLITKFPPEIDNFRTRPIIPSKAMCEIYPEIDLYADVIDLDPALARAVAWGETGLNGEENGPGGDTCEFSQVESCSNCLTSVPDPAGVCNTATPISPNKYIHSIGIMQVHTYPAEYWDEVPNGKVLHKDAALWCGGEDFNPFNKENNICLGTMVLRDAVNAGMEFVENHEQELGLHEYEPGSDQYNDMKSAISVFVGSYLYSGASGISGTGGQVYATGSMEDWAYEFSRQIEVTDDYCSVVGASGHPCCERDGTAKTNDCCNNKVFIDYVAECKYDSLPQDAQKKADYGFNLLGRYRGLMQTCEQYDAEGWRQAIESYVAEDMEAAAEEEASAGSAN